MPQRLLTNEPRDIEKTLNEPWDRPFRLKSYATTDLPDATAWTAGLVYDVTTTQIKWSDGTNWTGLQPLTAASSALAGLTPAADKVPYFTSASAAALATLTSVARTLIAQTTQALMRTTGLGLGSSSVKDTGTSGDTVPVLNGAATTWANGSTWGGALTSTVSIGYATGAGSTVTQLTSKATGVTLNKACGQITMHNASLAATTSVSFTLTNSAIAATDVVIVNIASGATTNSYITTVQAVAAGSCSITLRNYTAGALGEAVVLNFAVIKGVSS